MEFLAEDLFIYLHFESIGTRRRQFNIEVIDNKTLLDINLLTRHDCLVDYYCKTVLLSSLFSTVFLSGGLNWVKHKIDCSNYYWASTYKFTKQSQLNLPDKNVRLQ